MNQQNKTEATKINESGWLGAILVIVVLCWAISPWVIGKLVDPKTNPTVGDLFAPINALFSGLAFACFMFAVYLQRKELALQREELKLQRAEASATRAEIHGQKEEAKKQNETLNRQAFENTFFELLRFHVEKAQNCEIHHYGIQRGRQAFVTMFALAFSGINNGQVKELTANGFSDSFLLQKSAIMPVLFPYIKNVVALLKFIQSSNLTNKELYLNLFKAQLSNDEQKVLMISAVADLIDSTSLRNLLIDANCLDEIDLSDGSEILLKKAFDRF